MEAVITNTINNERYRRIGLWLGILVFIRTQPCYLWALEDVIRPLCAILIMFFCVMNMSREKWTKWILLSIAFAYIWASVFVDKTNIITIVNFLAFAFIPTLKKEIVHETYKTFYKIVAIFLAMSIVNYLLHICGIDINGKNISPLNDLKRITYTMYPFLVVPSDASARFFSIYDEPGVVGTICAMIIVSEKLNFHKKINIIFLIAGLLSMSMFFYVGLIMGVIIFTSNKRRIWYALAFIVFFILTYNNSVMYDTLWSRFEYDSSSGRLAGDNRTGGKVGDYFDSIVGTPIFFLGHGSEFVEQFTGEASLKLVIIKYGFIFAFFNLLGYVILSLREIKNKKEWVYFILFFFVTIYQRPGFINTASIFLYTMLIYSYASNVNQNNVIL